MKYLFVLLQFVIFLPLLMAGDRPFYSKNDLVSFDGPGKQSVREILQAIADRNDQLIRSGLESALAQGHPEIVALFLKYPASNAAMRAAAETFGKQKSVAVARDLLGGWDITTYGRMGGGDLSDQIEETRGIFEKSIEQVTGIKFGVDWSLEKKRKVIEDWIKTNDNSKSQMNVIDQESLINLRPENPATSLPEVSAPTRDASPVVLPGTKASLTPVPTTAEGHAQIAESRVPIWVWVVVAFAFAGILVLFLRRRS